jgi:hypothetical protein
MIPNHRIDDNNNINIISVGHVCIFVASDKSQLTISFFLHHSAFAFTAKY